MQHTRRGRQTDTTELKQLWSLCKKKSKSWWCNTVVLWPFTSWLATTTTSFLMVMMMMLMMMLSLYSSLLQLSFGRHLWARVAVAVALPRARADPTLGTVCTPTSTTTTWVKQRKSLCPPWDQTEIITKEWKLAQMNSKSMRKKLWFLNDEFLLQHKDH